MKRICLVMSTALVASAAQAASVQKDTPTGRYALDMASCKAKDYFLTLTDTEAELPTFSCKEVSWDQIENKGGRATYAATSKACMGEESVKPRPEKFTLIVDSAGVQIVWSDGTKSAVFLRCPAK